MALVDVLAYDQPDGETAYRAVEAGRAGVPIQSVGKFTGDTVKIGTSEAPLAELSAIYRNSFGETFA